MQVAIRPVGLSEAVSAMLGARPKIRAKHKATLERYGGEMVRLGVAQYRSAADTTETATARRTGQLAKSYSHQVTQGQIGTELEFGVFADQGIETTIAGTHEYGATIRPKRARYLTIPLPAAKDSRGVAPPARTFLDTFVARSKAGNLILFQRAGTGIVPLFLLHPGPVRIPPRPALLPAFNALRDPMEAQLTQDVADAIGST